MRAAKTMTAMNGIVMKPKVTVGASPQSGSLGVGEQGTSVAFP